MWEGRGGLLEEKGRGRETGPGGRETRRGSTRGRWVRGFEGSGPRGNSDEDEAGREGERFSQRLGKRPGANVAGRKLARAGNRRGKPGGFARGGGWTGHTGVRPGERLVA